MCLAFPGKVIEIKEGKVLVEYPEESRPALLGDEKVKIGDYVLVQMGVVIKILSSQEIKVLLK